MRRSVKSHSEPVPVDAHERTRDYVTEEEFLALVGAARQSRHHYLVRTAGRRAGLALVMHPHMLRHGCGHALANRGYDLRLIQDYLGHRDPKHTTRYTHTAACRFEGLWSP
jgi:site-specific recombinase XerD